MKLAYIIASIYFLVAVITITFSFLSYLNRKKTKTTWRLTIIYLLLAIWVLSNAFMQLGSTESTIIFWHEIKNIVIPFIPVLLFLASVNYTSVKLPFKRDKYYLFFVIPMITLILFLTNSLHGLFRKSLLVVTTEIISVEAVNGFWYWIHGCYSYMMIAFAILVMLQDFLRQPQIYKTRPGIILIGIIIPTVLNFYFDSGFVSHLVQDIEVTPLAFTVSMIFVYYAMNIYKPKNIIPIARNLIVESMGNPIILFDKNNITIDANRAATRLLKSRREFLLGKSIEEYPGNWQQILLLNEVNQIDQKVISINENQAIKYYTYRQVLLRDKKLRIIGRLIVLNDISELQEAMNRLEYLSLHDQLTGLKNRIFFEQQLQALDQEQFYPLGIVIGDVNGLKVVNDAFGHESGDLLLQRTAAVFEECCGERYMVARIGGDEFAILLPNTDSNKITDLIDVIKKQCETDKIKPTQLGVSFGFAIKTRKNQNIREVLKKADELMYKQKMLEFRSVRSSMIATLLKALAERNIETEEHLERTRKLANELGKAVNLPGHLLDDLSLLALLHDAGKLGIPDYILLKKDKLNQDEWEIMKQHSERGYSIASSIPELASIAEAILYHHERWDGKGYPHRLTGKEIPLLSRIIAIVDAFDVMTHDRPYHTAISVDQALEEIARCSGTQFDPLIASAFINMKKAQPRTVDVISYSR
jgi:diguanylate cyclase (GGDEF)-like protein